MKKQPYIFLYFSLFVFHFSLVHAQQHEIDSLRNLLRTQKEDTTRVNILNQLSEYLWQTDKFDTAKVYSNQAIELGQNLKYLKGLCKSYRNLGIISWYMGNYPQALGYYFKGLPIAEQIGDKKATSSFLGNIGILYDEQSNYEQALEYYQKALGICKETNNKRGISTGLSSIGVVYREQKNFKQALEYDTNALAIDISINNKSGIVRNYGNIGLVYGDLKNTNKALECCFKALAMAREIGNRNSEAINLENIGSEYLEQKKYVLTYAYLDSALSLAKYIGSKEIMRDCYGNIAQVDSASGNMKKAFEDFKCYIIYRDSMKNEANTKKLVSEQMQYDFDKKEATDKAEQDKKDAVTIADKKKQQIVIISVSIVLLLVGVFAVMLLSRFRITQRQKIIIEKQKTIVEEKNKEVHDSKTYAKRLQDAILPPLSTIKKYLPESFVLYKPKDIVAGDFYWMERVDDSILIAACDSTGHGVPGAMVGVVCSNALNRALKEFKIRDTGKLLDKVRELVLETFEKSEGEVKDGMDCSICAINTKTMQVEWSGAYNPLWYIEQGEMKELGPDKQPIGKDDNPVSFSSHTLNLQKGDSLYLFTDGYADQFGGPKGKKFKYKQLQQLIMDNARLTMEEQKKLFDKTIEDWKGNLEQVDDILIIGIRI